MLFQFADRARLYHEFDGQDRELEPIVSSQIKASIQVMSDQHNADRISFFEALKVFTRMD